MAAGIQIGLQKATGFRSLSYRQAHEMLMSISYLCYASTDDVLSFLELRRQSARVFQPAQPWVFRSSGLSSVHSHPWHLDSPGGGGCPHTSCPERSWCGPFPCPHADLLASVRTVLPLATAPRLWCSAKGFSLLYAFLSCGGLHFPLSWHLCRKRSKPSHLLRNWTSVSEWLTVHLHLNCLINLNWLNWFSKLENKNTDLKKKKQNHRSKLTLKLLSLSSSKAQVIPEWISQEVFSCSAVHAAGLR